MSTAGCSTTSRHVQPAPGRGGHWIKPVQRNSGLMVPASNLLTGIVSGFTCRGCDCPDSGGRRAVTPNERIVGMTRSGSPKLRMCRAHMSTVIIMRRQAHHAALANQTPAQRRMSSCDQLGGTSHFVCPLPDASETGQWQDLGSVKHFSETCRCDSRPIRMKARESRGRPGDARHRRTSVTLVWTSVSTRRRPA